MTGRRMPWAHVAPSMQTSFELARDHHVSHGPKVVLHAVHYLLGLRQTLEDHISTVQIAREIGLWDGQGECPPGAKKTVGRHLSVLADTGAITYEPSHGRGRLGRLALPVADPLPGCVCSDCRTGKARPDDTLPATKGASARAFPAVKGAVSPRSSDQERRAPEPEKARAAPRTPSEKARSGAPLPRVETPRSLPEVGAASDGPSPSGAVRSGVTPNGAGADPAPPDDDMPEWIATIWATAPEDMTQDTWAGAIIDALRTTPNWFFTTVPAWFKDEPPTDLAHASRIIKGHADRLDVDIRLPKGPK